MTTTPADGAAMDGPAAGAPVGDGAVGDGPAAGAPVGDGAGADGPVGDGAGARGAEGAGTDRPVSQAADESGRPWFRPGPRTLAAAGLLGALALTAWFLAGGPARQGVSPVTGAAACPALTSSSPLPPPRPGLQLRLVPVLPLPIGPLGASVCHYPGAGSDGSPEGAVLDATRTSELAGWLDSTADGTPIGPISMPATAAEATTMPTAPPGGAASIAPDRIRYVLTFRYPDGPDVRVTLADDGTASNGFHVETGRGDLLTRIDTLLR